MCTELRICPVVGCTSLPLKFLLKHLENVHPTLTPEEAGHLSRTAAVFRVPAGKKRMEAVVRKGKKTKLQLAKKSTGGMSEHEWRTCNGNAGPAGARPADQCDLLNCVHPPCFMVDKATQCDLLPPGFLEPLDRALCAATPTPPRPQYARKSTSSAAKDYDRVRKKNGLTLMKKRVKFAERCSPTPTNQVGSESEVTSPTTIPMDTTYSTDGHDSAGAGKPCEMVCKWGNWDVIFYETPQLLPNHYLSSC